MGTKHKHAEVIKAWADGEEVEYRTFQGDWALLDSPSPTWSYREYRVKTKKIVVTRKVSFNIEHNLTQTHESPVPNIQYVFTREGTLVSVEMLK